MYNTCITRLLYPLYIELQILEDTSYWGDGLYVTSTVDPVQHDYWGDGLYVTSTVDHV